LNAFLEWLNKLLNAYLRITDCSSQDVLTALKLRERELRWVGFLC